MLWNWSEGRRIGRLPAWLRGPALVVRNVAFFPWQWRAHRERTASVAARDVARRLELAARYIDEARVSGEVAEFGTDTGFTAGVLARCLRTSDRRLWLFDSFEGLPAAESAVDRESPHIRDHGLWGAGECRGMSERQLRRHCRKWLPEGRIVTRGGWFRETVGAVENEAGFALIHVDCDLYQSTLDALGPLFEKGLVRAGAMICFDDWNCNGASPEFGERRAWRELAERFGIIFSDEGSYGWGGRAVIVQGYGGGRGEWGVD